MEDKYLRKDLEKKTKKELMDIIVTIQDEYALHLEGEKWEE